MALLPTVAFRQGELYGKDANQAHQGSEYQGESRRGLEPIRGWINTKYGQEVNDSALEQVTEYSLENELTRQAQYLAVHRGFEQSGITTGSLTVF